MVEGGGFEPPKASPTDLQSVPFDHSGTPPFHLRRYRPAVMNSYKRGTTLATTHLELAMGLEPATC